jgi:hypothetical protein
MNLTRRSIFAAFFVAPLARLRRIAPLPLYLGPGWIPLSEFSKTAESAEVLSARAIGVWSDTLIFEAQRKTFASQLFGDASSVIVNQEEHEE